MNDRETYLSINIYKLFIANKPGQFDDAFGKSIPLEEEGPVLTSSFNNLMERIKIMRGGNLIIPLNTIKQYINEIVNNITPK